MGAMIDALVSASYVLLTFGFSNKYYDLCCGCADKCCYKLWKNAKGIATPRSANKSVPPSKIELPSTTVDVVPSLPTLQAPTSGNTTVSNSSAITDGPTPEYSTTISAFPSFDFIHPSNNNFPDCEIPTSPHQNVHRRSMNSYV